MEKKFCKFCRSEIDKNAVVCPECGRQLKTVKTNSNNKDNQEIEQVPFYKQAWFMYLTLIFFAPLGIYLMYKYNDKFSDDTKKVISVVAVIWFIIMIIMAVSGSSKEYTIDGKTYKVTGNFTSVEEKIGEDNLKKLITLGVTEYSSVTGTDTVRITSNDNKKIVIELKNKEIIKIYNADNKDLIYYSNSKFDDIYDFSNDKKIKDNSEARKVEEKRLAEEAKKAKAADIKKRTKTFTTGTYIVGVDIDEGLYDAIAVSGNGNLIIYGKGKAYNLKVNEVFGVDTSFYTPSYKNLKLEKTDKIMIKSGVKVKFQAK